MNGVGVTERLLQTEQVDGKSAGAAFRSLLAVSDAKAFRQRVYFPFSPARLFLPPDAVLLPLRRFVLFHALLLPPSHVLPRGDILLSVVLPQQPSALFRDLPTRPAAWLRL